MIPVARAAWLLVASLALAGCGQREDAAPQQSATEPAAQAVTEEVAMATVAGEVFYRERIMLPPGAELQVQLEDISRADAVATVVAEATYTLDGGPPYPFEIDYDPAVIDERMRYALRARITLEGELRFTNTEYIDPFAEQPIRIMVQAMAASPDAGEGASSARGAVDWVLATLAGEQAPLGAGEQPVELQLDSAAKTVAGFSGCNRFTGPFKREGQSTHGTPISFGQLAVTMRACPDGMELEQQVLAMLAAVNSYRVEEGQLVLLAGDEVLATFKPR